MKRKEAYYQALLLKVKRAQEQKRTEELADQAATLLSLQEKDARARAFVSRVLLEVAGLTDEFIVTEVEGERHGRSIGFGRLVKVRTEFFDDLELAVNAGYLTRKNLPFIPAYSGLVGLDPVFDFVLVAERRRTERTSCDG